MIQIKLFPPFLVILYSTMQSCCMSIYSVKIFPRFCWLCMYKGDCSLMCANVLDCHTQPTNQNREWLISPIGYNPWWTAVAALIPALLCTILIFMDQQITAVIVNRKENKLQVSCAFRHIILVVSCMFRLQTCHTRAV